MLSRFISKGSPGLLATFLPLDYEDHDKVDKNSKTAQEYYKSSRKDNETGKDRLYLMFSVDEFGRISSEVNSIYQAGFFGFLSGAIYGGFIDSRIAYMNFMERNQATSFTSTFEAKRKLQDKVTTTFAKGAFKWGWRLSLFTSSYVAIVTTMSVYRGETSIWEYLTAGCVTGTLYKFSMGPKGMAAGGLVGLVLGGIAGGASILLLRMSGTTMEEVRYWQYKWRSSRDEAINESFRKNLPAEKDTLLELHDKRLGDSNIDLSTIAAPVAEQKPVVTETPPKAADKNV